MSDFLTNLAARSLSAPTLRPRTRAIFEPEVNASPWATLPSSHVAERGAEAPAPQATRRSIAPPVPEHADGREQETQPTRPAQRSPDHDEPAPERRPQTAVFESQPHDGALPSYAPPELRIERVETHHETSTASHTRQTTEILTERVLDRAREQHDTTVRIETPRPADANTTPDPMAPRHRNDEQPPRIAREARQPSAMFIPREPRPSPRQTTPGPSPSSEPVIHVSIGRVEVRAVVPAPTPQRSRARNAPMTVEDYAARRNAKGRP
jgi:hypothetical protein